MPINALTAGVAALAINSTAFTIEIFRGGFAAVPVAQHDAARALGLRPALIMALVVVPQVFRIVLPPLGNQIVSVVLSSAQASIIGVAELTYQPAFSFWAVNRSGHNHSAPAKHAGFWGTSRVAEGIIQWVTQNLPRFASRSILNFASSSAAPPSRPTRGCCSRASWTSVSA